jgi:hypothetical protein
MSYKTRNQYILQEAYVCMYVCTRVGQRLALAPLPLMIYFSKRKLTS